MELYKDSGHQPVRLVPADPAADADLLRAVPAARPGRQDGKAPRRPDRRACAEQFGDAKLFGAHPDLRHVHSRPTARSTCRSWPAILVRDDRDDVPHPAPADEQEHAGRRAERALRPAAEDAALRPARRLRRRWHRLPDRRAPLLDHLQPVDDGPAVLRDPQQPGARHAGVRRQGGARRGQGGQARPEPDCDRSRRLEPRARGAARRRRGSSRRSSPASSARSRRHGTPAPGKPPKETSRTRVQPATRPPTTETPCERPRPQRGSRRQHGRGRREADDDETSRTSGRAPSALASRVAERWSRRATSPPTTSRSCSTSPTSTATWTWTSRATAPRSPSSAPTCRSWSAATARCSRRCRS